jgi:hypothetical protein
VAELRTVIGDPEQPVELREVAGAQLARLAAAGVPGADPDEWWGLRPLSDSGDLAPVGELVRVSPSTVESALRCGLRWLLERHGGSNPPTAKQGIGNLVHAAAMLVEESIDRPRCGPMWTTVRPDRAAGPLARGRGARAGRRRWSTSC